MPSSPPGAEPQAAGGLPLPARIFIAAVGFRLVVAGLAFMANLTLAPHAPQAFSVLERPDAFWDSFARWDSGWYHGIASKGYAYVEGGRNNLAFFPLYPMAMGAGGRLLGGAQGDFYFTGIMVSLFAFAAAMVLVYRLARLDMPEDAALRAAGYAAVLPGAYFFGMVYPESLFFLTLVGAAVALRERRWGWAMLAGAAMTATRVTGVMFVPALVLIGWSSARNHPSVVLRTDGGVEPVQRRPVSRAPRAGGCGRVDQAPNAAGGAGHVVHARARAVRDQPPAVRGDGGRGLTWR